MDNMNNMNNMNNNETCQLPASIRIFKGIQIFLHYFPNNHANFDEMDVDIDNEIFYGPIIHKELILQKDMDKLVELGWSCYNLINGMVRWRFIL